MPIYEYQCDQCGYNFEVLQKISEKPILKCEKCGKLKAKRIISQTSFLLKGSGWYTTEYAGKKKHGVNDNNPDSKSTKSGSASIKNSTSKSDTSKGDASKNSNAKNSTPKSNSSKNSKSKSS